MFTNNFIALQKMFFVSEPYYGAGDHFVTLPSGETFYIDTTGSTYSGIGGSMFWGRCQTLPTAAAATHQTGYGVHFGSGGTPAAKDDYKLEAPITSGINVISPKSATQTYEGNGVYSFSVDFVVSNTSNDEIIIREVGLFAPVGKANTNTSWAVLMERTVLQEPLVILAGGSKLVTYEIKINQTAV